MEKEIDRIYNVCNMQITMHSILHGVYHRRSLFINITLLTSTFVLNILVFANLQHFSDMTGIAVERLVFFRGVLSAIVFVLILINLNFRWADLAKRHQDAKNKLSSVYSKTRYYWQKKDQKGASKLAEEIIKEYEGLDSNIIEIPSSKFNYLKSKHLRKKEFSKFISKNPRIPYILQKYRFLKEK